MSKGFGEILAEVSAYNEALHRKDNVVKCPLCGGVMEDSGVAWFCYQAGTPNDSKCPEVVRRGWLYDQSMQGKVLGYVYSDRPLVELLLVRGGGGATNLKVIAYEYGQNDHVPKWIDEFGWTLSDECKKE